MIFYGNPLPVAAAVVLNERHEVLLIKRKNEPQRGMWCLPIGFAETGESIAAAALRELREETGLGGRVLQLLDADSLESDFYGDMLIVTYEVEKLNGAEIPGDDAEEVAYFPTQHLPKLAFSSNEKAIRLCRQIHREEWMIQDSVNVGQRGGQDLSAAVRDPRGVPAAESQSNAGRAAPGRPTMKCPFLKEAKVRFCEGSPFRKMVRCSSIHEDDQKCSSPAYVNCPAARERLGGRQGLPSCPFLRESRVQYCAAAPVAKYIPYSDDGIARCSGDAHRYCELYLRRAQPQGQVGRRPGQHAGAEGIPVPERLAYTRNHMWIDVGQDGSCHVGVDAFLARVLGEVERVTFVSPRGRVRPAAVLRVHGVDLSLTFPCRMNVTGTNALLRMHPEMALDDPYGAGWLFEGTHPESGNGSNSDDRGPLLLHGGEVKGWMHAEVDNMSSLVHELHSGHGHEGQALMADGGVFCPNLAQHLEREELLHLFNCFFASE
jgi:ADP-ribose pyrophosphatase YjhB (NUDIX family)/glycine cleavage system H lipoate-binding protein